MRGRQPRGSSSHSLARPPLVEEWADHHLGAQDERVGPYPEQLESTLASAGRPRSRNQTRLKMADEQTKPPFSRAAFIPDGLDWPSLMARDGDELEVHYRHLLGELGRQPGMLGVVFRKAQNRIQDPAKLRRLIVDLIDREQWMTLDADVKGDAYEGLLQKNAEDVKTGAGQYFTPRPLIKAIVEVMRPAPGMTICDPACGTGGFLLAAHEHISHNNPLLDRDQKRQLRFDALHGSEIVDNTARLCVMNLLLHGIGAEDADSPITVDDSLKGDPGDR